MSEKQQTRASIQDMLTCLNTSFSIYLDNYLELAATWHIYESDTYIFYSENWPRLNMLLHDLQRFLHNYLASAASLVDHSRIFKGDLGNAVFSEQYDEELKKVKDNKCRAFVKDLRNYAHHHKIVNITASFGYKTGKPGDKVTFKNKHLYMNTSELLTWNGWKSDAKEYIKHSEASIELKTAIDEYQCLIFHFSRWIFNKVSELYPKEYRSYVERLPR